MPSRSKKKRRPDLQLGWSPTYQHQQLDQQLAQLIEQEAYWELQVQQLRKAVRAARRQLLETQRGQERIRAVQTAGWPLFEERVG